jgi:hypothetical protein
VGCRRCRPTRMWSAQAGAGTPSSGELEWPLGRKTKEVEILKDARTADVETR